MLKALFAGVRRAFRCVSPFTPVWRTRDGRRLKVSRMEASHLRNCVRAIDEGRLFPCGLGDEDLTDFDGMVFAARARAVQLRARERWRKVFTGELAARGLSA